MVEKIRNQKDLNDFISERELSNRLRNAVSYCKGTLELTAVSDRNLNAEQRMSFERCLTENYLVKHG